MSLDSSVVGSSGESLTCEIDARRLMAYAAGIGESAEVYLDTTRAGGIVAHPLFPVSLEWPALLGLRAGLGGAMSSAESLRGVHASHDTIVHQPIRPGMRLRTTARVVAAESTSAGAYQVTRFDTTDVRGDAVVTTWYGTLFRKVELSGESRPMAEPPAPVPPPPDPDAWAWQRERALAAEAAHVYTECARIWNPIHTDLQVARLAGLPGLILHGTATLAIALSPVIEEVAGGDPARVRRVGGRFRAAVPLPSRIEIRAREPLGHEAHSLVHFEVRNAEGKAAISRGFALLSD